MTLEELEKLFDSNDEPEVHSINHVSEIPYHLITDYQKTVNSTFHQMLGDYYTYWEKVWEAKNQEDVIKATEQFIDIVKMNTLFCNQYVK